MRVLVGLNLTMSDDGYEWRSVHGKLTDNPTLGYSHTFGQEKSHLAKEWNDRSKRQRKILIERLVYYSAIHEVEEL